MADELTLPERLRVCAALNPDGFSIHLSRDAALFLVKMMEERQRVAEVDKWVHGLLADREAWFDRRIKDLDQAFVHCAVIAISALSLSWLIAWRA